MSNPNADRRISLLVLDDGDTWEQLDPTSNALVVDVTPAELDQLANGERIDEVVGNRTGTTVAWIADQTRPAGVVVEFFHATSDVVQREGSFDWVHLEGRSLLGVVGDDRTEVATLDPETWTWRDRRGNAWGKVSIGEGMAARPPAPHRTDR